MEPALCLVMPRTGVLLVGCISDVGGGLIGDLMAGAVPEVPRPVHGPVIALIVISAL